MRSVATLFQTEKNRSHRYGWLARRAPVAERTPGPSDREHERIVSTIFHQPDGRPIKSLPKSWADACTAARATRGSCYTISVAQQSGTWSEPGRGVMSHNRIERR